MSRFVFLYRSTRAAREEMGSAEQMQAMMRKWSAWMKELRENGRIEDPGMPLEMEGKVVAGPQRTITDGPYAEAKDLVGGFTLVEAADLAQAAEIARGCPIFEIGGLVEVRPVMEIDL